jgi:hypothetical protein
MELIVMNNNQQSNKTPVGTNAEKAYIEGKESQKGNQFDYIPVAT